MRYIDVKWHHSYPEHAIRSVHEINEQGWETRKVEFFADGTVGFASSSEVGGRTEGLALAEIPPLEEINRNPAFEGREVTPEEFEEIWAKAKANP